MDMSTTAVEEQVQTFAEVSPAYKELIGKLNFVTQLRRAEAVLDYDRTVVSKIVEFAICSGYYLCYAWIVEFEIYLLVVRIAKSSF